MASDVGQPNSKERPEFFSIRGALTESVNLSGRCQGCSRTLVVVFLAKMCDQIRTHQETQRVLQLHGLDEDVVLRV
jgi:hypothetical protein